MSTKGSRAALVFKVRYPPYISVLLYISADILKP